VCTNVGRVIVLKDNQILRDTATTNMAGIEANDGHPNRFKFLVSKDRVEVWASNFDDINTLHKVATAENLSLDWEVGYVHFQHSHYNGPKAGASSSQTYRWDNIGFDGPIHTLPRGYDVPNNTEIFKNSDGSPGAAHFGYDLVTVGAVAHTVSVNVDGVDLSNATGASLNFNFQTRGGRTLNYRINGHDWHSFTTPAELGSAYLLRSFSLPVNVSELTTGQNTIEMNMADAPAEPEAVANMDITVEHS
jgi:hypothetical protein